MMQLLSSSIKTSSRRASIRTLGSKDSFWFRYSAIITIQAGSAGIATYLHQITDTQGRNYGASWVHTFSRVVLQAQYGRAHQEQNTSMSLQFAGKRHARVGIRSELRGNLWRIFAYATNGFAVTATCRKIGKSSTRTRLNVHQYKAEVSKDSNRQSHRCVRGELTPAPFESLYNNANVAYAQQQTFESIESQKRIPRKFNCFFPIETCTIAEAAATCMRPRAGLG